MNTKATIITTYYEGKQYLVNLFHMVYQNSENLKSLGYSVEFVIVNDSPWEKIEIPSQYSDMEVVVSYNPQNLGIHKSRVNGINLAHGDYILLLDQDDSITDDYLKEQLNAIESADISVCNGYKELEQKKKIIYRDRIKFSLVKNPEIYLKAANQIVSPGQCLIKKSSIPTEWLNYTLQVNGSDDLFLWLLCLAQNKSIVLNEKKLYTHNQVGSNLSNDLRKMCLSDIEMCEISKSNYLLPESYLKKRLRLCGFIEMTHYTQKPSFKSLLKYSDIVILKLFAYFV